jgi:small subunit ribosomal protein S5
MEAVGVRDILSKSLRTSNPHNVVRATFEALKALESVDQVAARRGIDLGTLRAGYTVGRATQSA